MNNIYQICIPHTHKEAYTYEGNDHHITPGCRVIVPFRNSKKVGIVLDIVREKPDFALKSIIEVLDETPILSAEILSLCRWVSSYYQALLSEVLPLAIPKHYRDGKPVTLPAMICYALKETADASLPKISGKAGKQRALIHFLAEQSQPVSGKTLEEAGFQSTIIKKLISQDVITISSLPILPQMTQAVLEPLPLNDEQLLAVNTICHSLEQYRCFFLQGVTGSGKTEVYLQVITAVLARGKQVLVLVPEIGLTPQLLARFTQRLQTTMAIIHSRLNDTERQIAWQMAANNQVKLIIGTRAAIFTPMPNLGLIVIDEEHDSSLKQMEGVRYSARDTALIRALRTNIPLIAGSATPSLETLHNCLNGKYTLLKLNRRAISTVPLHYQLVDIRNQTLQQGLSSTVLNQIKTHLAQDNQVLVFINRRGFSPVLFCQACGWMADCKACDSHFTLHRKAGQLVCHHCGNTRDMLTTCLSCHQKTLLPIGAGTQRIEEVLEKHFPDIGILRIDRDAVSGKHDLENHLQSIHDGEARLIIGTQMLAKGHDFPRLTLVVILDADTGLFHHDFRALEHLGQLLTQVSGRAGRALHPGQVLIQTLQPQHPLLLMLVSQGYETFAKHLLESRKPAKLPPWYFLALIRAQAKKEAPVLHFLKTVKTQLAVHDIQVLGPAPAPLARKGYQFRMQLLIKSASRQKLHHALTQLREWLTINFLNQGVHWNVDVDPVDLS